ncbi:L-tyrosine isonitrile synthase [Pectobacterium carotovorum]|nr:L-tyrosine isonitrile synthase [Pectobacterium carotovorum]KHS77688.1 paerucumarin biosynthesis protein PvcA [Pectobacterium carotovorum subsp. carotovorum]KHT10601.1 paerucumarin biosynthesis protein PvcA [Pectobacterium carotovorum subsp. carotovorum]KHT27883.1 paerucumarin biosynthesis protein PvcA [Pectobacterium carotovorum subsp. carotovorum]MBB1528619.1 L-tyrosine/L-tryptophan isonitrile synthase family protein [Pectobacterium carotovorum subsp. carotovorum]MCA6967932.1 isocyanide sy
MYMMNNELVSSLILSELIQYRRRFTQSTKPISEEESQVTLVQLPRIRAFVEEERQIELILPAFPFKSPSPYKVLGRMPDMAERLSLIFLNSLCQRIQLYYPPGAHIRICSDGHVFGDLIGTSDETINIYQDEIENLLHELGAVHLSVFNLKDVENMSALTADYDRLRQQLVENYADSEEEVKAQLMQSEEGLQLYRSMTRFLYEDSLRPDYTGSNAALQKDAKKRACSVIQRSWAWGNLLAEQFPDAIRLSIHPQPSDSLKLGIHMMPTKDDWLTPWHGVAANVNGQFVLMKNIEAQQLDGEIVEIRGMPSHYLVKQPDLA